MELLGEEGFDDITAVLMLPIKYRKRLRTTNEIKRFEPRNTKKRASHSNFS